MMEGEVTADREAVLRLTLFGPQGEEEVRAVIDTGFSGYLTLPPSLITRLGLTYLSEIYAVLADGSRVALEKYEAHVLWDGRERDIVVLGAEGGPLAGISLLYGNRITLDLIDGGRVRIDPLPLS